MSHPLNPSSGEQDHYCDEYGTHHKDQMELHPELGRENIWRYPITCDHPEHDGEVTVYRHFKEKGLHDKDGEYITF